MPANLTPAYFEAEKQFRRAKDIEEKIEALQKMLSVMPKHKGTDKLHGDLRRKLARLTEEAERQYAASKRGDVHRVRKEGAGQVVLVGLPNAGKSEIVAAVTGASTEVAEYPFSTHTLIPGMMKFENIQIQLVDAPPITSRDAMAWLSNAYRSCDALLVLVDLGSDPLDQMENIVQQLETRRIRLMGIAGQEFVSGDMEKKALVVGNKNDLEGAGKAYERLQFRYGADIPMISISARNGSGLEGLGPKVYTLLDIIRVYTKAPGGKPELADPVVLKRGSTVEDAAGDVHKDFRSKLKYALVWGSGKYEGQRVKRAHVLQDGDIIELHI